MNPVKMEISGQIISVTIFVDATGQGGLIVSEYRLSLRGPA